MNKDICITHPSIAYNLLKKHAGSRQENIWVITLSGAHTVIKVHNISKGTAERALCHPREVFFCLIKDNASAFILVHNHPSGVVTASEEDNELTCNLDRAAKLMGFRFLDHIIISKKGYLSYQQEGMLTKDLDSVKFNDLIKSFSA